MDGIHDVGGMQGFGRVQPLTADPPFQHRWEGKAFAIGALAARIAGTNLPAFRHAIERVPPPEYLRGYWNRWTMGAQLMMEDSGIITDEQVRARAARLSGQDVAEPPDPEPHKPQMEITGPGNLRELDTAPAFAVGDRVRAAADVHPTGHTRLPRYVRGRTGTVAAMQPAAVFPDSAASFDGENPQHCYTVEFDSAELWGPDAEPFRLTIDLYEPYLEPAR
ncbi:MAG: nitrile hydratase subunit beta [Nocardiopsaceae bacterium]|jgi:nitrile hydratase|nr:nitrile hydratase subunit beta [Nocardiopsaceae bacterium]